jgi:DNA-binding XRE family transcriptional regulator
LEQDKAQKQSAYLPGVDKTTIADWEADRTVPQIGIEKRIWLLP